jgi:hypothetical protein
MRPSHRVGDEPSTTHVLRRRRFLATAGATALALTAGCAGGSGTDTPVAAGYGGAGPGTTAPTSRIGSSRPLISDQPTAIGDFDSLEVTLDRARIFRETTGTSTPAPGTAGSSTSPTPTGTTSGP